MALRQTVVPLDGLQAGVPYPVVINCDYWFLRVGVGVDVLTIDGVPGSAFGILDATFKPAISIDYPPIFDAQGRAIRWNQRITFVAQGAVQGVVIMVTDDAGLPQGPR